MKLLTKNTDYAVRALMVLGEKPEEYVSSRDIAKAQKMPYQYVRKILKQLIKKGFVVSKEGGKGGFRIKMDPLKIELSGLIEAFQGEIQLSECMFRNAICHNRAKCVLRKNIKEIEQIVAAKFKRITIGSLLRETGENK